MCRTKGSKKMCNSAARTPMRQAKLCCFLPIKSPADYKCLAQQTSSMITTNPLRLTDGRPLACLQAWVSQVLMLHNAQHKRKDAKQRMRQKLYMVTTPIRATNQTNVVLCFRPNCGNAKQLKCITLLVRTLQESFATEMMTPTVVWSSTTKSCSS